VIDAKLLLDESFCFIDQRKAHSSMLSKRQKEKVLATQSRSFGVERFDSVCIPKCFCEIPRLGGCLENQMQVFKSSQLKN
jgi:hypothetical protein